MMRVYIIQACDDEWSSELEIVAATLDKNKAKAILRTVINEALDNAESTGYFDSGYMDDDGEEIEDEDLEKREDYEERIDTFINDMVEDKSEKREKHYSDEFPGGRVWCVVQRLK